MTAIHIGGTGRCGTSLLVKMFAHHPDVVCFSEPRFISDENGLAYYILGKCRLEDFADFMLSRSRDTIITKQARTGYPEAEEIYSTAQIWDILTQISLVQDRIEAGRLFIEELFGLMLRHTNRHHWVEKTPHTMVYADLIYQMFPDMRYIHIIRDPRDVFASMREQNWGPDTAERFVPFYMALMKLAWKARGQVPAENYKVISFEDLVYDPRGQTERIWEFVGLPYHLLNVKQDNTVLEASICAIDPERAHIYRWVRDLTTQEALVIINGCHAMYYKWMGECGD